MKASVIICTHNPNLDYLTRALETLQKQTLDKAAWELLLVDNASDRELTSCIDLSWHSNGRICEETKLGLTPARIKGIEESQTSVIVFVDDDNLLDSDYLEKTIQIEKTWPQLGAWGGRISPLFEKEPPAWTKPYWYMLAIRDFNKDIWSNCSTTPKIYPCGAGLCIRRHVAETYIKACRDVPLRQYLDRKGNSLSSSGDTDMAYMAFDLSLGLGQFTSLHLHHIIPPNRVTAEYLLKLNEGMIFSDVIMKYIREMPIPSDDDSFVESIKKYFRLVRLSSFDRKMYFAGELGRKKALQFIKDATVGRNDD